MFDLLIDINFVFTLTYSKLVLPAFLYKSFIYIPQPLQVQSRLEKTVQQGKENL